MVITSAELTAYWRSQEPKISLDPFSKKLVSFEGAKHAKAMRDRAYPLVERHLAVRSRFFFEEAKKQLQSKKYDACISLGSGLSLLTYYLAKVFLSPICLLDVDTVSQLILRKKRLQKVKNNFTKRVWERVEMFPLDIEKAYRNKKSLTKIFSDISSPIFLMEGLTYYLTKPCLAWLFREIALFQRSAVVFDYWPTYARSANITGHKVHTYLEKHILEKVHTYIDPKEISKLAHPLRVTKHLDVKKIEKEFVKNPLLKNVEHPAGFVLAKTFNML